MPNIPGWNRMCSEVGRTPNSATPPQSTCGRLPEDETGQIRIRSGPGEKRSFWQTPTGLNVLYSLEAGQWLASRQVARAHGRLVAYSGNENRIGLKTLAMRASLRFHIEAGTLF